MTIATTTFSLIKESVVSQARNLFIDDKTLFFKDNWYKFIDKDLIVK